MGWSRYWRRRYWDAERATELASHLEQEIADNLARGMSRDDARRAAHRALGNVTLIREEIYQMNTVGWFETLWRDLRYGLRLLRRNPVFSTVAILTLALGTGANTAMFQLVNAVRLRTLPISAPQELVEIRIGETPKGRSGNFRGRRPNLTNALWNGLRDRQQVLSSVMAWSATTFDLAPEGEVRMADGLWVSGEFFRTLGVPAVVGRVLAPHDDRPGCATGPAVISHAFWQREFGGNPGVVGRGLSLDGHRFEVVGVTPAGFFGVEVGRSFDVAIPLCTERVILGEQSGLHRAEHWFLASMGRLKPGVTTEAASAQLAAISTALFEQTVPPGYNPEIARDYRAFRLNAFLAGTGVSPLRQEYEQPLWILLAATGVVLLIVCANLANLMLARATVREREIAVRLAIGASRRRVIRQLLSESVSIAALGAAAGLLLARWLTAVLVAMLSAGGRRVFIDLSFDWRVFAFTAAVATLACLVFGLTPALRATAAHPIAAIRPGGRGQTGDRRGLSVRRTLVVAQVALSLVLIVGALLFARTFRNLATLDAGFRQDELMTVSLDFRRANVPGPARRPLYDSIVRRLAAVPGVSSAAEAFIVPVSGPGWNNNIIVNGVERSEIVELNAVSPGFFRTMGTPLVAGRDFGNQDTPASPRVAIVNEIFATKFLGGRGAVGRTFQISAAEGETRHVYHVVGLVGNTKYRDLREDFPPIAYLAVRQEPETLPFLNVLLHAAVPAAALRGPVIEGVRDMSPAASLEFQTMREIVQATLVSERLMATLSAVFGVLAMVIASVGLYGMMSFAVARRRVEIGIRMALGADRSGAIALIMREAIVLVGIGAAIGTGLALTAARTARGLLYNLDPWDPATLLAAVAGLSSVALLASWLPARRASRLEPTIALRESV
jgi:predicted permease